MTTSVELVLLKCPGCTASVPAEEEEVAWVCTQCGQGMRLTSTGLASLSVNWAAARKKTSEIRWLPFWVFTGTITFIRRESYSGRSESDKLWNAPRRFYVPAFPAPLEHIETLGADLTRKQVALKAGPAIGALTGCTLFPDDAQQAVEFVVLTMEAERKDKLRSVEFTLDLGEPEMWMLPFAGGDLVLEE